MSVISPLVAVVSFSVRKQISCKTSTFVNIVDELNVGRGDQDKFHNAIQVLLSHLRQCSNTRISTATWKPCKQSQHSASNLPIQRCIEELGALGETACGQKFQAPAQNEDVGLNHCSEDPARTLSMHGFRFQVLENRMGHEAFASCLVAVHFDAFQQEVRVTKVGSGWAAANTESTS